MDGRAVVGFHGVFHAFHVFHGSSRKSPPVLPCRTSGDFPHFASLIAAALDLLDPGGAPGHEPCPDLTGLAALIGTDDLVA